MPAREISTTIKLDGEKAFNAALRDAQRELTVLNSDLKAAAAEFAYTGDKQQQLTTKSRMLSDKIAQQDKIVEALTKAVKDSAEIYGDASKQTDNYRIKLSNATAKLFDMRKEAEQANRDLEELGRDSGKIGRQIERGIGDVAEDTADKLDGMFAKVAQDVNALKSNVGIQTALNIGGFVIEGLQSAVDFVEENREYRRLKSFAEQSARRNNMDIAEVEKYANEIAVFFGDYDSAVETIAVLTEAGFTGKTLGMAVDNIIGAAIAYYNTLTTENLAESIQETIATGELTGQYAELIDRLQGQTMITAEDLNKSLAEAKTQEEKLEILMAPLTEAGMQSNKFDYEARNAELLKAARAERELQDAWANLAAEIEPVVAGLVSGTTTLVDGIANIVAKIKEIPFLAGIIETLEIEASLRADADKAAEEAERLRREGKASEEEVQKATEYAETKKESIEGLIKFNRMNRFIETMRPFISPKAVFEEIEAEGGWGAWLKKVFIPPKEAYPDLIPSAGAETLPTTELEGYGAEAWQEITNGMMTASESNPAVDAAIKTALAEMEAEDVTGAAKLSGKNLMIEFGNGIAEGTAIPINNVANMVNQINAMLAQIAAPAFGLGWSGMTGGNIYLYNQQKNAARSISRFIGSDVQNKMLVK